MKANYQQPTEVRGHKNYYQTCKVIKRCVSIARKRRNLTQTYDKNPITTENSETNGQHKNVTKNFDYTTIADRLRTVSWSNNSYPTGVVKPVYGYPTFPLPAKAV